MGTNFYWTIEAKLPGDKCGRPYGVEIRHIGKSSAGWVFALHVYPEQGICDLPDWVDLWKGEGTIKDEYGRIYSVAEMESVILVRFGMRTLPPQAPSWHSINGSEPGPWGLAWAKVDGNRVIGHGLGTYALHTGPEESW